MMTDGNNHKIDLIVDACFKIHQTTDGKLRDLADGMVQLILQAFAGELKSSDNIITEKVLKCDDVLPSDSFNAFSYYIKLAIEHNFDKNLPNQHYNTKKKYVKRFMHIYHKLAEHIMLAQVQRDFILNATRQTQKLVDDTHQTVTSIKQTAQEAKQVAEKAESTYQTMFANYIAVLGIFTAIIMTIFGGFKVVDVALQNAHSPAKMLFLVSVVMFCLFGLIYFLVNAIIWIKEPPKSTPGLFMWTMVAWAAICTLSALLMVMVK